MARKKKQPEPEVFDLIDPDDDDGFADPNTYVPPPVGPTLEPKKAEPVEEVQQEGPIDAPPKPPFELWVDPKAFPWGYAGKGKRVLLTGNTAILVRQWMDEVDVNDDGNMSGLVVDAIREERATLIALNEEHREEVARELIALAAGYFIMCFQAGGSGNEDANDIKKVHKAGLEFLKEWM